MVHIYAFLTTEQTQKTHAAVGQQNSFFFIYATLYREQ